MNIHLAMQCVNTWKMRWAEDEDKRTPMESALLAFYIELDAMNIIDLHNRAENAERKANILQAVLNNIQITINNIKPNKNKHQ